jgi:hypothetical protein
MTIPHTEITKFTKLLDTELRMEPSYTKTDGGLEEKNHHLMQVGMLSEFVKLHTLQRELIALALQSGVLQLPTKDLLKSEKEVDYTEPDGGPKETIPSLKVVFGKN